MVIINVFFTEVVAEEVITMEDIPMETTDIHDEDTACSTDQMDYSITRDHQMVTSFDTPLSQSHTSFLPLGTSSAHFSPLHSTMAPSPSLSESLHKALKKKKKKNKHKHKHKHKHDRTEKDHEKPTDVLSSETSYHNSPNVFSKPSSPEFESM